MSSTYEPVVRTDSEISGNSRNLDHWSLVFIGLAAVFGWTGSFIGLHAYALAQLTGYNTWTAWAIPGAYDLAAFGCTFAVYRASINGRSAFRGRFMMWGFTAVSASINWIHQHSNSGHFVAAGLPVAAVIVFDFLMTELRADWEKAHGRKAFRLRPALLFLRFAVDRKGTRAAFRDQITAIPVSALAGLGADLAATVRPVPDTVSADADTTRTPGPETITPGPDAPLPAALPAPEPTAIDPAPGHGAPEARPTAGSGARPALITVPTARTSAWDTGDSTSETVLGGDRPSIVDTVRRVYTDTADTATIIRSVRDVIPEAKPETIRRATRRVRTERAGKPDTTGVGQYL
jgi:Protein of unknown function (DUF2637)